MLAWLTVCNRQNEDNVSEQEHLEDTVRRRTPGRGLIVASAKRVSRIHCTCGMGFSGTPCAQLDADQKLTPRMK